MRKYWLLLVVMSLVLTGCGGDDDPEDNAPTATAQPSRTPLPPTWTASPQGFVASPTATLTLAPTEPGSNPTGQSVLPPTWTPGTRPSITPRNTSLPQGSVIDSSGTATIPTPEPAGATWTPQPEYCQELQPMASDENIVLGQPASVMWQPITNIPDYEVAVWFVSGEKIFSQRVSGVSSFEIPADVFTVAGVYGYEITPLDANGQKICYPISWELFVSLQ